MLEIVIQQNYLTSPLILVSNLLLTLLRQGYQTTPLVFYRALSSFLVVTVLRANKTFFPFVHPQFGNCTRTASRGELVFGPLWSVRIIFSFSLAHFFFLFRSFSLSLPHLGQASVPETFVSKPQLDSMARKEKTVDKKIKPN